MTLYADLVFGVAFVAPLAEAVADNWDNPAIAASVWVFLRATTTVCEQRFDQGWIEGSKTVERTRLDVCVAL